ncbi:ABC transporter substrate-binding protein [Pusillimonas sp.]|uniref:ABC transporter substrate-binding protein n=1 Tax=Pusillimonas sp. TaxID=3040095 RepID=UPI0037C6FC26
MLSSLIRSLFVAMLLCLGTGVGAVQSQSSPAAAASGAPAKPSADATQQGDSGLKVGVRYAPPPFVGGTKVRTPESIETLLVEAVAKALERQPRFVGLDSAHTSVAPDTIDFAVVDVPEGETPPTNGWTAIATGQVTHPMAIMRTDTDIRSWRQLTGRTVCVAEDGRYVGHIAEKYGAIEQVYRAPADSLLALRIGECDAAVHDDTMLKALLRFPEWKKFSASLSARDASVQYFLVSASHPELAVKLQEMVKSWKTKGYYGKLIADMTQDIAFEVYLDQAVPDCH